MKREDGRMTLEELREKLKELGVLKDGETNAEVNIPRDIHANELDYVKRVSAMMTEVESLLEHQVKQDQALVQDLHVKIKKMQHGGGL
tara:strand:- start:530 stop:793 length:264 start_codon:yes stop_codon:yes gene_type:complete